ncbi:MAG: carbon starvation protein A [Pseudomonadota bacterium]
MNSISVIVLISIAILILGYRIYGRFLTRTIDLDDTQKTPACEINNGVDYVPAKASMLLGQHFSAIVAAGPIVGPILAGKIFGWIPALLWIIIGSLFIGGVHDFTSLIASVRHRAASIGQIVKQYMSHTSYVLFMIFVWLALIYVIIAFTDITAQTFAYSDKAQGNEAFGPGVAISSMLYLAIGLCMGFALYRFKIKLWLATLIFLPLVFLSIWAGTSLPSGLENALLNVSIKKWEVLLLGYCMIASILPMWLLLQPRGYLGGWFLYFTMAVALMGALFGGLQIKYPAVTLNSIQTLELDKLIFPMLFITIACGACSGFHSVVASGTTSKQLAKESDAFHIGYGAMILEAIVAVLALATVMALSVDDPVLKTSPNIIYASGLARYLDIVHISRSFAFSFALLAFATFVYDTLDVCTRLARYIIQELLGWESLAGGIAATLITLAFPMLFLMTTEKDAYKAAWPIFGASNQMLAGLTLLAISVWLKKTGRNALFTIIPMFFMLFVTFTSLILQILPVAQNWSAITAGTMPNPAAVPAMITSGVVGIVLLVLSIWLVVEACRVISGKAMREKIVG